MNLALTAQQQSAYLAAGEAMFEDLVELAPRVDGEASKELYGAWDRSWGNGRRLRAMVAMGGMSESPNLAEVPATTGIIVFPASIRTELTSVDRVRWLQHGDTALVRPMVFKLVGEPLERILGLTWAIELAADGVQ